MPETPTPTEIADCDGTPTCTAGDLHNGMCLGLYRTEREVAAGVVPTVFELERRRWCHWMLTRLGHGRTQP